MKSWRRISGGVLLLSSVAACTLPRNAPLRSEIVRNDQSQTQDFAHYEVDSKLLPVVASWRPGSGALATSGTNWPKGGTASAKASGQIIAPGDAIEIGVWENGDNKLMTTPGTPSAQLQATRVSASGNVFVPYVGAVKVAGLSPDAARERIQSRVAEMIPAAQVQLNAKPGTQNSVDLVGGVASPGQIPLDDRSLTVLGLIARGGGVPAALSNPQLKLFRGGRSYSISMKALTDNPANDITVQPGDKLIVGKDERSFIALGATGQQKVVYFPKDQISAIEAVSLLGGVDANRANPKGVLILRQYPASAVHADGKGGPTNGRVVFSINLTTTDGLFSAQNFTIQPGDLVVGTESPIVGLRTILSLFNTSATSVYYVDRVN